MTPKFNRLVNESIPGRPPAYREALLWSHIEAYIKGRIEEGWTRDQIRTELRQRLKDRYDREDIRVSYSTINKVKRKHDLKIAKNNKWQTAGYTDRSVDYRYPPGSNKQPTGDDLP